MATTKRSIASLMFIPIVYKSVPQCNSFLCSDSKLKHQIYDEPQPTKSEGAFTELLENFQREDTKAHLASKARGQVREEEFYFEKQVKLETKTKQGRLYQFHP